MSTYWSVLEGISSFGYKDQASYNAGETGALSGFTWLDCSPPSVSLGRNLIEVRTLGGQVGTQSLPRAGSRAGGTVEVTFPLRSQTSVWDPTSAVVTNPGWDLLIEAWGSSTAGTYDADELDAGGTNAYNWGLPSATVKIGSCYAAGEPTGITSIGWMKDVNTLVYELFEDGIGIPETGENLYPLTTVYSAHTQPTPKTLRFVGDTADQDIAFYGCIPTNVKITADAGGVLLCTLTYRMTSWAWLGAGTTQAVTAYMDLPPLLGVNNARVILNGGAQTGTADATGTCGVSGLMLECALGIKVIECHGGSQGEATAYVTGRTYTASLTVPHSSGWLSAGDSIFDASLEDRTAVPLSIQVGVLPGKLFAALYPGAVVIAQSQITIDGDLVAHQVSLRAHDYSGDSVSTNAANSVARLAFG